MANNVDPDQSALLIAVWSGSAVFAKGLSVRICRIRTVYLYLLSGLEKEPKLPYTVVPAMLKLLNMSNMHPVKV